MKGQIENTVGFVHFIGSPSYVLFCFHVYDFLLMRRLFLAHGSYRNRPEMKILKLGGPGSSPLCVAGLSCGCSNL